MDESVQYKEAFQIIARYGEILERTSQLVLGVPQSILPCEKNKIEIAFLTILHAINNPETRSEVENLYHASSGESLSFDTINSITVGFLFLANFIPDDDAEICMIQLLNKLPSSHKDSNEVRTSVLQQLNLLRIKNIRLRSLSDHELSRFKAIQDRIISEQERLSNLV